MNLIISLLLVALFLGPLQVWDATRVSAQTYHEPRIEGVSLAEIAQWQTRYGGGPFCGQPGLPGYGAYCGPPFPVLGEPPACRVKKARKWRKGRK